MAAVAAGYSTLALDAEAPFQTPIFKRFVTLQDALQGEYGRLCGYVNWSGVLNLALDLRGQAVFLEAMNPILHCSRRIAKQAGHLPTAHALRYEQHTM